MPEKQIAKAPEELTFHAEQKLGSKCKANPADYKK